MHREYHPEDMQHRRAHAFGDGHDHDRDHEHVHGDDHRSLFVLTAVLGLLLGSDLLFGWLGWESWRSPFGVSLAMLAALLGGARIVYGALEALLAGRIGADIALAQACIAALILGEPFVAAEVVFIALVGEVLEAVTADRAMRSIGRLFEQTPRMARVRRDGIELEIPIGEVVVGDVVVVGPGERVPVAGPVLAGRSAVDQSALTGESMAVDKGPGDPVYTGTVNQFGRLECRAEKVGHETTLGQVLRLVAEAQSRKAPLQRAADRYARLFLPVVELVAGLTVVAGYWLGWPDVWHRTVAVLVVACPCALVLATPAAILASMAWLARHGVVIKGGIALERLAACDTFAFDKTGTLTVGRPELASVVPFGDRSEDDVLRLAAAAESSSRHPLALVVSQASTERGLEPLEAAEVVALPGSGVWARVRIEGDAPQPVLVGNARLMAEQGIALDSTATEALDAADGRGETSLLVAVDGSVVGLIGVRDQVRPEAHDVIHDLKHLHIKEIAILTGDRASAAKAVAKRVHIKTVEAELLPADKARWIAQRQEAGRKVAMVGDGINDAPALAKADVGIAIGGPGADLAAEAGDVVVLGEPLRALPDLVGLSRATVSVIRQNILGFAFGLNAVAMGSATLGWLGPVPAAILHQAGSLLVLLNAMRLLVFGDWQETWPVRRLRSMGDAIRRLDDRLDPGRAMAVLLRRWRWFVALAPVVAMATYVTWGWTTIGPDEVGLLQRQGRFVEVLGPGLHLRWPPPLERVTKLAPERLRSVSVGFRTVGLDEETGAVRWESSHDRQTVARRDDEALLLTGDGQLVEITTVAQYHLDPRPESLRRYAFGAADADAAIRPLTESAVRAVVGRKTLEQLLTVDRHRTEEAVADNLQRRIDDYGLGLIVRDIAFQEVHPPLAVVDAYRDVSRAGSERQRRINEANTYRAERVEKAKGLAAATLQAAAADRDARIARAEGESAAFLQSRKAHATAPALTEHRLYWESLATALAGKNKVILDPSRAGNRRHLIVPDVPLGSASPAIKATVADDLRRQGGKSKP